MDIAMITHITWHATLKDATILLNCDGGKRRMNHRYVWMEEIGFEIELAWEFQIQARKKMASNLNSIVWVCLELKGGAHFQFLFVCTNNGIGCFVEFRQYNLVYI
jgi:hypothetical protein